MNTVSDLIATLEETRPGDDVLDYVASFCEIDRARLTHYPDENLIRIASLVESGPLAVPLQLKGEMIDLMIRNLRGEDGFEA